jgi:putative selenium metabolism hydrolase
MIKETLEQSGITTTIDVYGNVVATLRGTEDCAIMLEGHMDCVPPGNPDLWDYPPYSARIVDGIIYGRGTVDMKGGLAAMITSMEELAKKERAATVYAAFVVHEETIEGAAIEKVIESLKNPPDFVILGEPTHLNIAVGHRGRSLIRIELVGKTAHASMPDQGVNTLEAAAHYITTVTQQGVLPMHPSLGKATITPISIECTPKGLPQLPDTCEIVFDRRLLVNEKEEDVIQPLKSILVDMEESHSITGAVTILEETRQCWTGEFLKVKDFFPAWIGSEKDVGVIRNALAYGDPEVITWEFSTDGVYTAHRGIPTVGFGPGNWSFAHQPNEAVPLKEVEQAAEGYTRIIDMVELFPR